MEYSKSYRNKIKKVFLIGGIFVAIFYIAMVIHVPQTMKFDKYYKKLHNPEEVESSYEFFISQGDKASNYLLKRLSEEKDDRVKVHVLQIIGAVGCSNCEEEIISCLEDPVWRVRFFAIDTLEYLGYKGIRPLMRRIIRNDKCDKVKIHAIMTLGKYGDAEDKSFLQDLLNDEEFKDDNLKAAIKMSIKKLYSHDGVP